MPYIITVDRLPWGPNGKGAELHAVATLEEAREAIDRVVRLRVKDPEEFDRWIYASLNLSESGGTIGPLPNGTVIEVERVGLTELAERASADQNPNDAPHVGRLLTRGIDSIIHAYNARHA